jgi:hypothetical protein
MVEVFKVIAEFLNGHPWLIFGTGIAGLIIGYYLIKYSD